PRTCFRLVMGLKGVTTASTTATQRTGSWLSSVGVAVVQYCRKFKNTSPWLANSTWKSYLFHATEGIRIDAISGMEHRLRQEAAYILLHSVELQVGLDEGAIILPAILLRNQIACARGHAAVGSNLCAACACPPV